MNENAVLEFDSVSFAYRDRMIFRDANFCLEMGSFCALVGSNGVGKSTAIKLSLGEETPQDGEVRLFGNKISRDLFRGQIGYVPQQTPSDYQTFPVTVFELALSGTYPLSGRFLPYGARLKKRARDVLSFVGLNGYENAFLGELSGGLLQRALLARALASGPQLLLLDEPTSNLDAESAKELSEIIASTVRKVGASALMVTHDIARLPRVFDRVIEVSEHRFIEKEKGEFGV